MTTTVPPILENESERVAALYQLEILDTEAEADFDDIVALASQICDVPMGVISFIDNDRSWFKSKLGVEFNQVPRDMAFCAANLHEKELLLVENADIDVRGRHTFFAKNPDIKFFAGVPLITKEGFTLGHLSVMDIKPREFNQIQFSTLRILAKQVVTTLALRSELMKLRKVQEESSDELMATFFKNAIDAVIVMDEKGVILQWNPKAEVIFGWKAEEAIGQYFHEIIIPERYREGHLKRMKMFGKDAILNKTIEIIALRKNTAEFDLALGISPTTIKGQQFFIGFANDITERKLVTQKLDNQKEFYENILNSLPTDIVVFDPNHKYIFVNPGAIKNDELRKYIIGKDDFEYAEYRGRDKSIAEKRREQFLEIQRESKEIRWEDSLKDPNGQTITHLRRLYPVFNDKDQLTMVIGFGIDITDRKMLEEKQVAYFDQVSAQNTQLIDFCNIVSHNLRAPLVNMSMLATFIEDCTDEIEQKILISKLRPVVDNLHATFNELVESIQIKQDLEVSSEVIALDDCMKRTLDGLEAEIANSGAVIETHFEVPIIKYPPKYLFSIFHNLVSNTLKYQSPDRKPLIKVSVKKDNDKVILSISDNGLGIDLTKHGANIFKIGKVFHRNANSKGFGLYMTKTHVEAMGGKIWVESTPEVGSTFFIEFKNQNI